MYQEMYHKRHHEKKDGMISWKKRKYHFEGRKKDIKREMREREEKEKERERYCYKEIREGKESLGERTENVHRTGWT